MARSKIEWTESSWNPVTGCTKISPGCKNCYAERMAARLKSMRQPSYSEGFKVTLQDHALRLPLKWRKPLSIFVNSMSDLFHEQVPESYIRKIFYVMREAHWHNFQVLTKRAERMEKIGKDLDWPANVWIGVSVESRKYIYRLDHLRNIPANVKFVSFEPLLAEIGQFDLDEIDWVIAGGESGPKARPMNKDWVIQIRDKCVAEGVPFFFKQWGGTNKKKTGRKLDGQIWSQFPTLSRAS